MKARLDSTIYGSPHPLVAAVIVFLFAGALAAVLIWNSEQHRLQKERLIAYRHADDHTHALQSNIERALSANYALAALVRQSGGSIPKFEEVAMQMLPFYPGVSALALSPDGIIQISVPMAENQKSIGLNQLKDPVQRKEALLARDTGKLTLSGPFNLVQGGFGAVGRMPVFLADGKGKSIFWGFTNVVIRFPDALNPAGFQVLAARGYAYELWRIEPNSGQKQIIAASSASLIDPVDQTMQVSNATWHLSIVPVKGWSNLASLSLKAMLGLLFSLLFSCLAKLLLELRAHKRNLERQVKERTREIIASQNQLQSTLDAIPDLLFDVDLEGRIHAHHTPRTDLLAVPPEVFLGKTFLDVIPPDAANVCMSALQEANETGLSTGKQYQLQLPSGKYWFELSVSRRPGEFTDKPRFIVLVRDISERKLSEEAVHEHDARYRIMFQANPLPMWVYDLQSLRFLAVNDAAVNHYGFSRDEFLSMTIEDIRPREDIPRLRKILTRKAEGLEKAGVWRHLKRDGALIDVEITSHRLNFGGIESVMVLAHDVTARIRTEAQLKLAAKVFEQSSEGFVITDADCKIIMINQAFTAITGYSETEVMGRNLRRLASGCQDRGFYRVIWSAINKEGHWQGEMWNRRKDGSMYPEWLAISRMLDENGQVAHYIGIFSDITQYKTAVEDIHRLAHFDSLTGLPNRSLLHISVNQAIGLAQRSQTQLAILFLDLDHFKNINDSLGHFIGDELLVKVAQRMKSIMRVEDTVSRQGGDEFILILPNTDAGGAAHVASKLLAAVAQPYFLQHHELVVTPSLGIAMYPADGADFESLAQCADVAMYRAKSDGRNTYRFFTAEMQSCMVRTLQLKNALHRALDLGQLRLHYQPQISLQSGQVIGAEALLRWPHPEWGMISPAEFIPVAEDSGQIISIGEWVLRTAIRQLKNWMDNGMAPMTIAVNLSAVQFRQVGLPALVAKILHEEQLSSHYLELELTESVAMNDAQGAIAIMDKLHEYGIRMSIDDFGTGYSSLSYLKRFKANKLKIDQSFVRGVTDDPEDRAIVIAIISLSRSLGFHTIAEGVESEAQLAFLREQGCDEVQGYYFSKPLPAADFEAFLQKNPFPESPGEGRIELH